MARIMKKGVNPEEAFNISSGEPLELSDEFEVKGSKKTLELDSIDESLVNELELDEGDLSEVNAPINKSTIKTTFDIGDIGDDVNLSDADSIHEDTVNKEASADEEMNDFIPSREYTDDEDNIFKALEELSKPKLMNKEQLEVARKKQEQDVLAQKRFEKLGPLAKASVVGVNTMFNGVNSLIQGSSKVAKDKIRGYNERNTMETANSLDAFVGKINSEIINNPNSGFSLSGFESMTEKEAFANNFMKRHAAQDDGFQKSYERVSKAFEETPKHFKFFVDNLDKKSNSESELADYIEYLEKIKERVPDWLKIGNINVNNFLEKLIEAAKSIFSSKFGSSSDMNM